MMNVLLFDDSLGEINGFGHSGVTMPMRLPAIDW
jgi:hypothetical protein